MIPGGKNKILDMDGVILERWSPGCYHPVPRRPCQGEAILTNQGGLALRWAGLPWAKKYPGFRDTLARVRAAKQLAGARLVLLAAYHPKQCQTWRGWLLARLGELLPPIPLGGGIWISLDPNHRKPSPGGLLWLCRRLGISPAAAVFVGDEPTDQLAAEAAGIKFFLEGE